MVTVTSREVPSRIVDVKRIPRPRTGPGSNQCWLSGPEGTVAIMIHCSEPIGHDKGKNKTPHSWEKA